MSKRLDETIGAVGFDNLINCRILLTVYVPLNRFISLRKKAMKQTNTP